MTGVEILAAEEIVTSYTFSFQAYFLFIFSITVGCIIIGIITGLPDDILYGIQVGLAFGITFGLVVGLIPAWSTVPNEYETQYKVTISDEVPMNDFLARYEIIDIEGKIYTVRELDHD